MTETESPSWPQTFDGPWSDFAMNDQDGPPTSQMGSYPQLSLVKKDAPLKCTFQNCLDQQTFPTLQSLKCVSQFYQNIFILVLTILKET
jgi:hypothetical protein